MLPLLVFALLIPRLALAEPSLRDNPLLKKKDWQQIELPLFEWGAGVGGGWVQHYPAADEGRFIVLPFPYAVYRGKILRADDDGVRGRLYQTQFWELDVSYSGALPVKSKNNQARQGMPDLDWLLEVGPSAIIHLANSEANHKLDLHLPVRGALDTDFSRTADKGYTFSPALRWKPTLGKSENGKNELVVVFNSLFADRRYNQRLYSVSSQFATTERPAYQAHSGYIGSSTGFFYYHALDEVNIFFGYGIHSYQNSANRQSPLFRRTLNHSIGFGFTWVFYKSERRAYEE